MYSYYHLLENGKIILTNTNTACFAEIFSTFNKNTDIRRFFPNPTTEELEFLADPELSETEVKKYLKRMSRLGIKTTIRILNRDEIFKWHPIYRPEEEKDTFIIVSIKLAGYTDPKLFKLHIHILRLLIEDHKIIHEYVKSKIPIGLDSWQFLRIIATEIGDRHGFLQGLCNLDFYRKSTDDKKPFNFKKNPKFKEMILELPECKWASSTIQLTSNKPRYSMFIKDNSKEYIRKAIVKTSKNPNLIKEGAII